MDEIWLAIPGWEGYYEVSDIGRVRSLTRLDSLGRRRTGRILKLTPQRFGYPTVCLSRGKVRRFCVHRLVAETFHADSWFPGAEVCHNDGDPKNNQASNLRWGTHGENVRDTVRHGTNWNASKSACAQGHEYTADNTLIRPAGGRGCRECRRLVSKRANPLQRELRKSRPMPERAHGTYGGYSNWDCRCEACRNANSVYRRGLREARLGEAS